MTVIWNEKIIDQKIRKMGYENVWCRVHDRPHMAMIDPLTLTQIRTNPWGRNKELLHICSAELELPITEGCIFIRKEVIE